MNSLLDQTTLNTVVPEDTVAYLRTRGWQEVERQDLRQAVWVKSLREEDFEILLPLDRSFRDYSLRLAELLATLEFVEKRPRLDILRDILPPFADVIRNKDLTLQGFVTDLHRADSRTGTVTVSAVAEDRFRKVRIDLDSADYDLAITAHRERLPVSCEGDLVREGKGYVLKNPRSFSLQREED